LLTRVTELEISQPDGALAAVLVVLAGVPICATKAVTGA